MIHFGKSLWIVMCHVFQRNLVGSGYNMGLMHCDELLRRRGYSNAALAAVIAHRVGSGVDDNGFVVNIGNLNIGDVVYVAVIKERTIVPITPFITKSGVTEAIYNAAIKANVLPPIARIISIKAIIPAPISRGP